MNAKQGRTPRPAAAEQPSMMPERPWGSFGAGKAAGGALVRMLMLGQAVAQLQLSLALKSGFVQTQTSGQIFSSLRSLLVTPWVHPGD